MSSRDHVVATRSNLLKARAQLERVRKGAQIVRRKRQALIAHLFKLARPAADTRAEIACRIEEAYPALLDAIAVDGLDSVRALARPERHIDVEVTPSQIWGVAVADVVRATPVHRTVDARGTPPGSTGPAVLDAANQFESLVELLIAAAPTELRVSKLADAVALTSQQLQVLEERVEPGLVQRIATVRRTLEEREREEHLTLRHLKRSRSVRAARRGVSALP
jgi:H(+)-transporting ATP synthase subunit D